jgi:hypothetical protein
MDLGKVNSTSLGTSMESRWGQDLCLSHSLQHPRHYGGCTIDVCGIGGSAPMSSLLGNLLQSLPHPKFNFSLIPIF